MKKQLILLMLLLGIVLVGCGKHESSQDNHAHGKQEQIQWNLVTSWPKNFPVLGMAPERFSELVNKMSNGRLTIHVYGAGEIVPAFEVFDAVSQGTAQMGHSASFYWKGKVAAGQFFTAIPFGMNAQEMNGWLTYGGGLELWQELYKPFGIIPLPGGNTGVQMGGWFNKEINSLDDLKGLKMRLPGLGGEVLARVGGTPVTLPGRELFTALQTGTIDATDWVGPFNDLAFGFQKVAKYYYFPGWHEPGATLEFLINEKAFNALPTDLQTIVTVAAKAINQDMLDEFTSRNVTALDTLVSEYGVQLKPFPEDVLKRLKLISAQVIEEQSAKDPAMAKIYAAYQKFLAGVRRYHSATEDAYLHAREN